MLATFLRRNLNMIAGLVFLFLSLQFYPWPAFAALSGPATQQVTETNPTALDMLMNIANQIPSLMRLTTAIAYVMGFTMLFYGLLKLKEFGEARTQMSMQHHIGEPLGYLITGALLVYLPTSVRVGMSTFWMSPNPYGYLTTQQGGETISTQWTQLIGACFSLVQLFGTIAFIRGLIILGKMGRSNSQETFGKGAAHLIGGIFCINMYQFVQVVQNTLGLQAS